MKDIENQQLSEDEDNGVDEAYIEDASKAVASLSPEDFQEMPGLKIPTEADDGEMVKVILTGKAKGGFLTDVLGAECDPGMYDEEEEGRESKGRIKIMIMGGNKEEGGMK